MASPSKPLTYESLKTVLQHLEPNKRFHVAQKCPTIRKTEKSVPLKIDSLSLREQEMMVNDTAYKIGTYRKYPEGVKVPQLHQSENKNGGIAHDLDEFGARVVEKRFQPGDLLLLPPGVENPDEVIRNYFTDRNNDLVADNPRRDWFRGVPNSRDKTKRDNVKAPFETMIALTVAPGCSENSPYWFWFRNSVRMELFRKSMPNHKAMKQILSFMFGGRREAVQVKKLVVSQYTSVLRLPLDLKFKVRELEVYQHDMSVLATVIDEKSYPLALLETYKEIESIEDISHPLVSTARKLILGYRPYNRLVAKLPNHEIILEDFEEEHLQLLFGEVLRHWTTNGREIGSSFTFDVDDIVPEEFNNWIMGAVSEFNGKRIDETTITVPLNHVSEIRIIHRKLDEISIEDGDSECGFLRIEVAPIEHKVYCVL